MEGLKTYLKETTDFNIDKQNGRFIFKSKDYDDLIDRLFDWLGHFPSKHHYSRLYEKFYRSIHTIKHSTDMLDVLDAQMALVLNYETVFKLFLLNADVITDEELKSTTLMLDASFAKAHKLLVGKKISESDWEKFAMNFNILKEKRNLGAHAYLHDDNLVVTRLVNSIHAIFPAYLYVAYFMKLMEAPLRPVAVPPKTMVSPPQPLVAKAPEKSKEEEKNELEVAKKRVLCNGNMESLAEIEVVARQGNTDAQAFLARLYANPKKTGIQRDFKKAFEWYNKLAVCKMLPDETRAEYLRQVAQLYLDPSVHNYSLAISRLTMASRLGNKDAAFQMGLLYCEGSKGTEIGAGSLKPNLKKARESFTRAMELGNSKAKEALERLNGAPTAATILVPEKKDANAETDYQKALSLLRDKGDPQTIIRLMEDAAYRADDEGIRAMRWLAENYRAGTHGLAQDKEASYKWLNCLAALDNPKDVRRLAACYLTDKLYEKAIQTYERLADAGERDGYLGLAFLYYNGGKDYVGQTVVEQNKYLAFEYFKRAAEGDNPKKSALHFLAQMYELGEATLVDRPLAKQLYEQAATLGYEPSIERLKTWKDDTSGSWFNKWF